jgi:hypothetical protein
LHAKDPGEQPNAASVVVGTLFSLVSGTTQTPLEGDTTPAIAGYRFEDKAAEAAYEALVRMGVAAYRPRYTLALPTISGLQQQFDVVVPDRSRYLLIELKRRSQSSIEQLYAFVAKLLDYALATRLHKTGNTFTGVFVSTAPRLNDNFRHFAIAYGVIPIALDLPPCHTLIQRSENPRVRRDAADLLKRLDMPLPDAVLTGSRRLETRTLLLEWQSVAQRSL